MTRRRVRCLPARRAWLVGGASCLVSALGCVPIFDAEPPPATPVDWNDAHIAWRPYFQGLADARAGGRAVVLIFYTDWCPHCHNYARLFHDSEVVRLASQLVMIRVERDANRELSARHDLDGDYVPRTFFLGPDARLLPGFETQAARYRYFLDEFSADELRSRMRRALAAASD